jgi:uncharacterized protein YggU (UPF0235/DUF167 family)
MKSSKAGLELDAFCQWDGDTLVLNVLGRPRANRTRIGKVIGKQLEIYVAENPVRGRATAHLVRYLAGRFEVSEGAITVVFGVYNVNKQLRIKAPKQLPAVIAKRLAAAAG